MVEIIAIEEKFPSSSAGAFVALAEDGDYWVVKAKNIVASGKRLFNSFVAGKLAELFQVSHPETTLVRLDRKIIDELNEQHYQIGVGKRYISNFSRVEPPDADFNSKQFPIINREHLKGVFGQDYHFQQFYNFWAFSEWIHLEDDFKYENLYQTTSGAPLFLDLDFAFEGREWNALPNTYEGLKMSPHAPFLEGIFSDIRKFDPFFKRLFQLSRNDFFSITSQIPQSWSVPSGYLQNIHSLLFKKRDKFQAEFMYAAERYLEI